MEQIIEKIASAFPAHLGGLSTYLDRFEGYVSEQLGAVPMPLIYLCCVAITVLLVYTVAKFLVRLSLYVVVPTIGSTLVVTYAFPAMEASRVAPIAGILFIVIFIFRH